MSKQKKKYQDLTNIDLLGRNTLLNLSAKVIPLAIGLIAIPTLIDSLGETRFGFLALIWLIIGYFSIFNLGMSPAIVRLLSEKIAEDKYGEIPKIVWTGIIFISIMGVLAGLLLYFLSDWLVYSVFEIEEIYRTEVFESLIYTSVTIPLIIMTSGFKAVMESLQEFKVISILQGLNSLLNYSLPLLIVIYITDSLVWVVASLLLVKVIILIAFIIEAHRLEKKLFTGFSFNYSYLKQMISFGKWVTASNLIGPLMGQLDRYFIGSFLSVSAITYYTTPLEILSKVMIIPSSAIAVLFPAFSTLSGKPDGSSSQLLIQSARAIFLLIFPVLLILALIAPYGLELWLGESFRLKSTLIAQIFCLVYLSRGIGYILSIYLQGINRPDLTAKFHFIELALLCISLYVVSGYGNLNYIAIVALGITILDTVLLISGVLFQIKLRKEFFTQIVIPLIFGVASIVLLMVTQSIFFQLFIVIVTLAMFIILNFTFAKKIFQKVLVRN